MIRITQVNKGMFVNYEDTLYVVVDFEHVVKGKGGSLMVITVRNIETGQLRDFRFRANDSIQDVMVEKKPMEYLYSGGSEHHLMDLETFDQIPVGDGVFGDAAQYIVPNTPVEVQIYEGKIVNMTIPNVVELEITDAPPSIKGATATAQTKPATMETGLIVTVPSFVNTGERIRVDTRTGKYIERAK